MKLSKFLKQSSREIVRTAMRGIFGPMQKHEAWVNDTGKARMEKIVFTRKAIERMKDRGLTEADAIDVVLHGWVLKENMLVRKYNGFEIGVVYGKDRRTGQTIVFSAWKRERR
jgi:hypothetical protein